MFLEKLFTFECLPTNLTGCRDVGMGLHVISQVLAELVCLSALFAKVRTFTLVFSFEMLSQSGDIEEGFIADFTFFHLKWGFHFEGFARVAQFVVLIPQTVGAKFLVAQLTSEKLLIFCGMLFKEMFSQTTQPLKRLVFAFAITTQAKKSSILFF